MATKKAATEDVNYSADDIKHLSPRDAVQKKTSMYIGATDEHGLFTIVREVADNILDEALGGHCTTGIIVAKGDMEFWIADNGRGMPTGMMTVEDSVSGSKSKIPALQAITSLLHAGGKIDASSKAYAKSRGSHAIGQKTTNFLSHYFHVTTFSSPGEGKPKAWYKIEYTDGKLTKPMYKCEAPTNPVNNVTLKKGTVVEFKANTKFFSAKVFAGSMLVEYLKNSTYFTPGFTWALHVVKTGKTTKFHSENGPLDYINDYKASLGEVSSIKEDCIFTVSGESFDVVLDFTSAEGSHLRGFTNGLYNSDGGTHVQSTVSAIVKAIAPFMKKTHSFGAAELKEGLVGLINAKLSSPRFTSQVKVKLDDDRMGAEVQTELVDALSKFFKKNKTLAESICERCSKLKDLRTKFLASKAVVTALNKTRSKGFPAKALSSPNCKPEERELYIVEGDSAKGPVTATRNEYYQEALPIRGKITNAHRAKPAKFFASEEVIDILAMIGFDPKNPDPLAKLRVGKIIFMTDSDADGPLTGNTRVMLCDGTSPTIRKLAEEGRDKFYVWAVDEDGLLVPALARMPSHVKTVNKLYRITFNDGTKVTCDASHKWFKSGYMSFPVKTPDLRVGDSIQSVYFRESGIKKLDKGERYLQWFDPRTQNYKFVHRRVKEAIDPEKYQRYVDANKGVLGGSIHIHHKDERPMNNDPSNLKYMKKKNHWGTHGSKMAKKYNGSAKHKADLAEFHKNHPENRIMASLTMTMYNISQKHRDTVAKMNADPSIINKQAIGKCARMYVALSQAGFDPADPNNWSRYKLVNKDGVAIPSLSYYAMLNLGISLAEVVKYVKQEKLLDNVEYTLLRLSDNEVANKLMSMQNAFCRVAKRLKHDNKELTPENYEEYRNMLSRPSNTPKWEGALASFGGSLRLAKRAVKNFNHTIKKIELIECDPTPVYCMAVPGYKNFLIKDKNGNGIVTGNCHISVLLLSMIHKYLPELIDRGMIYVTDIPEFMAEVKGKPVYADSKDEMSAQLKELGASKAVIHHFKGLGEMEFPIFRALAIDPETRRLIKITRSSADNADTKFVQTVSGDASSRRTLLGI
jgi:DNA gyrase subunit B